MYSDSDDDILLNNTYLQVLLMTGVRQCSVHDVNKSRKRLGEFHHLFLELKNYPDRLFDYIRMELATFQYILEQVTPCINKKWTNFNQAPIGTEEMLVVTIRLRRELDDLGYTQPLKIECIPLVTKLLSDLKMTTDNLQKYMKISEKALEDINNLESCAEPYKCDNAKLIRECNELHLAFIHFKEQHEQIQKDLRARCEILEDRLLECETEKENLRQQLKKIKSDLNSNLKNIHKSSTSSLGKKIERKEFKIDNSMAQAEEKIANLQKEIRKLKDNHMQVVKNNEFLKSQLENRNQEIQRLTLLLDGGRPVNAHTKECSHKAIDNKIAALQEENCALRAERTTLQAQLKEALAKQHEAMRRALHLAERNKQLEQEMKDIDNIALQVEAECNSTVRNNTEKVIRLQDRLNESMIKIQNLERDVNKLKQEKAELRSDLDALKLEKRHLQTALECETNDKKRLTDRINSLTTIEHDLNMEIDRLVRLTAQQKLKITELECYTVTKGPFSYESLKEVKSTETDPTKCDKHTITDKSPTRSKMRSTTSKKSIKKCAVKNGSHKESMIDGNGQSRITKCCCEADGCVKQMIELLNKEMEFRQEQASQHIESLKHEKEYYMKEYHKLTDELRGIPDRDSYNRVQRQYDELLKRVEEKNQIISDLQKEIKRLSGDKYKLSSRLESQHDICENDEFCQKTTCKRKQRELELHREEVKQLQKENESLKSRIQELNQSTIFDQERMKKAFQDMEEHIRKLEDERRDMVVNQLTTRSNISQMEEECNLLKEKLRATQNELNAQKANYEQLKTLHEQTNIALSDAQSQVMNAERELQTLQSKMSSSHRESAGHEREMNRLQNDIEVMKKQLTKLDKEKDDLLNIVDQKTEKVHYLEEVLREKNHFVTTLENELKELKRKLSKFSEENSGYELQLKSSKQELFTLQKDYECEAKTKEAALQENRRLQDTMASVVADCKDARKELEIARRQIDDLKRQLQHYVAEVKRFEDMISQKELERAEILDQFKSLSAEANHLETTNHSLETEAAQSKVQLSVALDHASDLERKLENQDAIVRSYEKQIADLSSQVATLEIQLKQRNAQFERLEEELRHMKDLCMKLDREKDDLRRELQGKEEQKGMVQRNIDRLAKENDDLRKAVHKDRNNVDGLEKLLNDARQEVIEQKLINEELQTELARMNARLEEVQEKLNITSEQLDLYQEKALEYSQQNKQLRREIANERFFRTREDDYKRYPSL